MSFSRATGSPETLAQVVREGPALEPLDVGGEAELAGANLNHSRHADDRTVDQIAVEPAGLDEGVAERGRRGQRFVHVGGA